MQEVTQNIPVIKTRITMQGEGVVFFCGPWIVADSPLTYNIFIRTLVAIVVRRRVDWLLSILPATSHQ